MHTTGSPFQGTHHSSSSQEVLSPQQDPFLLVDQHYRTFTTLFAEAKAAYDQAERFFRDHEQTYQEAEQLYLPHQKTYQLLEFALREASEQYLAALMTYIDTHGKEEASKGKRFQAYRAARVAYTNAFHRYEEGLHQYHSARETYETTREVYLQTMASYLEVEETFQQLQQMSLQARQGYIQTLERSL